ncbi:MAG: R3H domain protein [Candidatus Yanofskybacteria bacterium GW2011_GWA1_39_13]|uniref:R3H domain protein n=1 Tax=Yanofskybacteria sp. (strain GW2011_GWA1_39_13) TaxID=1619019 RepID=A0A0G0PWT5_YANXG|nr:MAG: R3H domain protein [Candidatus Yanofskybacteria bacterium GW2011_GWA1_39_13]
MDNIIEQNKEKVVTTIKKIIGFMNLDCQVEIREENGPESKAVVVSVYTPDNVRFIIGKNGQNLKAFEHLVRAMLLKNNDGQNIIIDINDYKKSRASFVVDTAKQAVTRVRNTQKAEVLIPMSAYERRIVHMELASYPDVATESIGDEPQRRIVIKPYP